MTDQIVLPQISKEFLRQQRKPSEGNPKYCSIILRQKEDDIEVPSDLKSIFEKDFNQNLPHGSERENQFELNIVNQAPFTDLKLKSQYESQILVNTDDYEFRDEYFEDQKIQQIDQCAICLECPKKPGNLICLFCKKNSKMYVIHLECARNFNQQSQFELQSLNAVRIAENYKIQPEKPSPSSPEQLTSKNQYAAVEINFFHPISTIPIANFMRQLEIFQQKDTGTAVLSFQQQNESFFPILQPKSIIIPVSEFRIHIIVHNIELDSIEKQKTTIEFLVDSSLYVQQGVQFSYAAKNSSIKANIFGKREKFNSSDEYQNETSFVLPQMFFDQKLSFFCLKEIQISLIDYFTKTRSIRLGSEHFDVSSPQGSRFRKYTEDHIFHTESPPLKHSTFTNIPETIYGSPTAPIAAQTNGHSIIYPTNDAIFQNRYSPSNSNHANGPNNLNVTSSTFNPNIYFQQFRRSSNQFEENSPELNPNKFRNGGGMNGATERSSIGNSSPIEEDGGAQIGSIDELKGKITAYVKTQIGSRTIQKLFEKSNQESLQIFIQEIEPNLPDLMMDHYANYMFGSLSQCCTPNQRKHILQIISPRLIEIACDKRGTHALQNLVSLVNLKEEEQIISNTIKDNLIKLALDCQGTHLIKKIILKFSEENVKFIWDGLIQHFMDLVVHQYGLCVIKDLMKKFQTDKTKTQQFIELIEKSFDDIVQDPYGNYAIQHAFQTYDAKELEGIIDLVIGKIIKLSNQKYSSNVVEKAIQITKKKDGCSQVILSLLDDNIIIELMNNQYGNFVLQRSLTEGNTIQNELLVQVISKNISQVNNTFMVKWREFVSRYNTNTGPTK